MSLIPGELKYSESHEWVRANDDGSMTVGITDHAQELLGDLVYVELPELDRELEEREACAVVESVKAASDLYAPIACSVVEVNEALADAPEVITHRCLRCRLDYASAAGESGCVKCPDGCRSVRSIY